MISFEDVSQFVQRKTPDMDRIFRKVFVVGSNPEAAEEATQEAIAITWQGLRNCWDQGMLQDQDALERLWRSNMQYAIRHVRIGRHAAGYTKKDLYDHARRGMIRIEQVNVYLLIGDQDRIPDRVQTSIDWDAFQATLSERQREMLKDILWSMLSNNQIADKWHVTPGAVSQLRARIVRDYRRFVGEE